MYSLKKLQFILKNTVGKSWHIYYDNNRGLCMSSLTSGRNWSKPSVIYENAYNDFYAAIDKNNTLQIIFQDKSGSLYYASGLNNQLDIHLLLKSKEEKAYKKNLFLLPVSENVYFFYTIRYKDKIILSQQIFKNKEISVPQALDYIDDNEGSFFVLKNQQNDIFIFYTSSDGAILQAGYKKYSVLQNSWSEFNQISQSDKDCTLIRAICDKNNILHCCYQTHESGNSEILYQQKIVGKNIWTKPFQIFSSAHNPGSSSILINDNKLIIFWIKNGILYSTYSKDNGRSWLKPVRNTFGSGGQMVCFIFHNSSASKFNSLICHEIPGNFLRGYSFAFAENSSSGSNIAINEKNFKNIIIDGMTSFKESIESLKSSEIEFAQQLSLLINEQSKDKHEITKLWLKIKELEKKIRALSLK